MMVDVDPPSACNSRLSSALRAMLLRRRVAAAFCAGVSFLLPGIVIDKRQHITKQVP